MCEIKSSFGFAFNYPFALSGDFMDIFIDLRSVFGGVDRFFAFFIQQFIA